MADAAASHAEEEMDQLYKPHLPVTCKILFSVMIFIGFCEWINSYFYDIACWQKKEVYFMMDMDIFQLFFNYLEATMQENKINAQCKKLDLSDKQRKVIMQWIDAIQAQESAYTAVVFRMGIQCCFSLLMELADL